MSELKWEEGKTYKLVDEEGFLADHKVNQDIFEHVISKNKGRVHTHALNEYCEYVVIGYKNVGRYTLFFSDIQFFEEVVEDSQEDTELSTEDKVKAELQKARANKQTTPPSDVKMTHHAQMQIGKKGSEEVFEYISAVEVEGKYYLIQYNGSVPEHKYWEVIQEDSGMKVNEVSELVCSDFIGAVDYWEDYKHYHLNPYTFLMVQMLHAGNDLVKMGIIEI